MKKFPAIERMKAFCSLDLYYLLCLSTEFKKIFKFHMKNLFFAVKCHGHEQLHRFAGKFGRDRSNCKGMNKKPQDGVERRQDFSRNREKKSSRWKRTSRM